MRKIKGPATTRSDIDGPSRRGMRDFRRYMHRKEHVSFSCKQDCRCRQGNRRERRAAAAVGERD